MLQCSYHTYAYAFHVSSDPNSVDLEICSPDPTGVAFAYKHQLSTLPENGHALHVPLIDRHSSVTHWLGAPCSGARSYPSFWGKVEVQKKNNIGGFPMFSMVFEC